jgi:hypothetical protein
MARGECRQYGVPDRRTGVPSARWVLEALGIAMLDERDHAHS